MKTARQFLNCAALGVGLLTVLWFVNYPYDQLERFHRSLPQPPQCEVVELPGQGLVLLCPPPPAAPPRQQPKSPFEQLRDLHRGRFGR